MYFVSFVGTQITAKQGQDGGMQSSDSPMMEALDSCVTASLRQQVVQETATGR